MGFPGTANVDAFIAYMKRCQLETTFFFADVNDQTVESTLTALKAQAALARFIECYQDRPAAEVSRSSNAHEILGCAAIVGVQEIDYQLLYPGSGERLPGEEPSKG